jgi:hypothetical protein
MTTNVLSQWYRNYRETSACSKLRRELLSMVHSEDTLERLINLEKRNNPGKPDLWYLEKIVYNLRRGA